MGSYVGRSIQSVLEPDVNGSIELIVLDDGSTDDTEKVLRQFTDEQENAYDPRVRYYQHENRGKSRTVNRGFQLARGQYITILDADDYMTALGLASRLEVATSELAGPDLIIGRCEVFGEDETLDLWELPVQEDPEVLRKRFLYGVNQPFHLNAAMWSADLLHRVGGFNPSNPRCHDIDYAARLLEHTEDIHFLDSTVYRYRKYRSSLRDRLRVRITTLVDRVRVVRQNLSGPERIAATFTGVTMDLAKLLYEAFAGAYPSRRLEK
jgi:glycosyltransferase involved in cell wall biosynthesis